MRVSEDSGTKKHRVGSPCREESVGSSSREEGSRSKREGEHERGSLTRDGSGAYEGGIELEQLVGVLDDTSQIAGMRQTDASVRQKLEVPQQPGDFMVLDVEKYKK